MTKNELCEMIREEIFSVLNESIEGSLEEKSVPEPYNRKSPPRRKMTAKQVAHRKKIGDAMIKKPGVAERYKKKHGKDWKSYVWAAASSIALKKGKD